MPDVSVTEAAPPSPGTLAIGGAAKSPWTPNGLVIGASFYQYNQGNASWLSVGIVPDMSSNMFKNLQLGITAQGHF